MAQTLAARLARIKETPIVPPAILAYLSGQGALPEDVDALAEELRAEAEQVIALRARLADVPPAITTRGIVLL